MIRTSEGHVLERRHQILVSKIQLMRPTFLGDAATDHDNDPELPHGVSESGPCTDHARPRLR